MDDRHRELEKKDLQENEWLIGCLKRYFKACKHSQYIFCSIKPYPLQVSFTLAQNSPKGYSNIKGTVVILVWHKDHTKLLLPYLS